jgi:hypothetical protein
MSPFPVFHLLILVLVRCANAYSHFPPTHGTYVAHSDVNPIQPRLNPCSQQAQSLVETHILHIPDLHPRMHRIRIDILQVLMAAKRVFLCYP